MVLTQKQKYRSMEQDSLKINSQPMVTLSLTKEAKTYNGEKTASSISDGGKTGELHVGILPNTIHKNKLKMD